MDWFTFLGSATTVVGMAAFLAIVVWAYSKRRRQAFEQAANAPFALPDDVYDENAPGRGESAERRS